jgi:ankyrin repeat protein
MVSRSWQGCFAGTRALFLLALVVMFSGSWLPSFGEGEGKGDRAITRAAPEAETGKVALVVGNKDYKQTPLQNPVNDATDMSQALRRLGFSVITRTNVNLQEFEDTLDEFTRKIESSDVALFYFSGHGCQSKGENYLVPVGHTFQTEADLRFKAMNAGLVLARMEQAKTKINIMILDACRDNPFKGFRSTSRGLSALEATSGTFIAYATAPGSVAGDSPDQRNGVYTKHLLRAIETPGLAIEQTFKTVLKSVREETKGQQTPWMSSSLSQDFFFNPAPVASSTLTPPKPATPVSPITLKPPALVKRDPSQDAALIAAATDGKLGEVRRLLYRGADVNARGVRGAVEGTPLHFAAWRGNAKIVELLLDSGAHINAKGKDGVTALHLTTYFAEAPTMQLLLDRGADINAKNNYGQTTLHEVAFGGNTAKAQLLLDRGADINAKTQTGLTALHRGAEKGRSAIVELLLDRGADVNAKDKDEQTALHKAAFMGQTATVELLLGRGADINAKDRDEQTALQIAEDEDKRAIADILRNYAGKKTGSVSGTNGR